MDRLLEVGDVARRLNLSPDSVRGLARIGRLPVAATTPRGVRLFSVETVEELYAQREGAAPSDEREKT